MNQQPASNTPRAHDGTARRTARAVAWIVVALLVFANLSAQSTPLTVEREGDRLRVAAPQMHFLGGQPLSRLHDGRSVTYAFSLSLQAGHNDSKAARVTRRVVFSYDLWEERFSVVQIEGKASASHLTAAAAEAWCIDLLSLPLGAAPADKTFVLKLECALRDDGAAPADAPSATTFTGLIDLFSRKAPAEPPRWEAISPPLRLTDIRDRARK
jgi:hypothetical protein